MILLTKRTTQMKREKKSANLKRLLKKKAPS